MPKLSQLTRPHPVQITFGHEGETVTVVFDRNKITQNWSDKLQRELENGDTATASAGLVEIIQSWDLLDDDENPLAPSVEVLGELPVAALVNLHEAIGEAATPTSEEGNGSSGRSSTPSTTSTEPQQTHQNGPAPSPSPAPSASLSPT